MIATQIFNYGRVVGDFGNDDLKVKPHGGSCLNSTFKYNTAGHFITGELNITDNENLRIIHFKSSKSSDSQSINWKHNCKLLMGYLRDYARK